MIDMAIWFGRMLLEIEENFLEKGDIKCGFGGLCWSVIC